MSSSGVQQNQLQLRKLLLTSGKSQVDLSHLFITMTIYEDIFANCMSGHLNLNDARGLMEVLPIMGEETLEVEYTTYSKGKGIQVFSKTFDVSKCDDYQPKEDNSAHTYTLHFQSQIMAINLRNRYNGAFGTESKMVRSSDIINDVCIKMLGLKDSDVNIQETVTYKHLVCANWSPFQLINHVAETSTPSANLNLFDKDTSYLFFEDRMGVNFVPLSMLLEDKLYKDSDLLVKALTMRQEAAIKDKVGTISSDINKVLEWRGVRLFDDNDNTRHGMYASKTYYYDPMKKNVSNVDYDYDSDFDKQSHVKSSVGLTRKRKNKSSEATYMYNSEYDVNNILSIMKSKYQQLENNTIVVSVSGCSGYRLGQTLSFDVPSVLIEKNNRKIMAFLSGDFLVSRIKSTMTRETIMNDLELIKGSRGKV